jgi:DNA modification methylase/transcriptional regulator with XRE-family HTH domain
VIQLHCGNSLDVLATLRDDSVDSIVTDPPYGLSFMGRKWDYDVPSVDIWVECLRVLKPGGHLLAFAGTRTQHRMAVNIEDAGFDIRDMIAWVYGSGFPKSHNIGKAIDKHGGSSVAWFGPWFRKWRAERGITQKQVAALFPSKAGGLTGCVANWELGFNLPTPEQFNLIRDTFGLPFESISAAEREVVGTKEWSNSASHFVPGEDHSQRVRLDITAPATPEAQQWDGWGTALKPALEPITVARKPFKGNVAANVLEHGTGAINIDGCRVGTEERFNLAAGNKAGGNSLNLSAVGMPEADGKTCVGRWPANLIHDGSDEVTELFGDAQRFFQQCKSSYNEVWQDLNPHQSTASTAESCSPQDVRHAASALERAASLALPEGRHCSNLSMEPSTTATASELKNLAESVTQAILNIAPRFWQEQEPVKLSLSINLVNVVVQKEQTGITTITASHWKSDGSAAPVTFSITPKSLEAGEKDYVARLKYVPKCNKKDRDGSTHPTMKPTDLMAYLCRLVTPPEGIVLDPFMGSGSTGKAAMREGFSFVGIEREEEYVAIASKRLQVIQRSILASRSADQNG